MNVYQTNSEGVFVGVVEADESPLEPGVFLIPGGCKTVEPPSFSSGSRARWVDDAWLIEPIPEAPEEPVVPEAPEEPEPTPAELRVSKAQALMALYNAGVLDDLEAIIAAHPYRPVRIWFENANEWLRTNPYVNLLGPELGLTDEGIDNLFIEAARL